MKRYMAFYGDQYERFGGTDNLIGNYDTIADCLYAICGEYLKCKSYATPSNMLTNDLIFYQIYDTNIQKVVIYYNGENLVFHQQDENTDLQNKEQLVCNNCLKPKAEDLDHCECYSGTEWIKITSNENI